MSFHLADVEAFVWRNPRTGEELVLDPKEITVVLHESNDIAATGRCCCNGCIGEGPCDLDQSDIAEDNDDDWQIGDVHYGGIVTKDTLSALSRERCPDCGDEGWIHIGGPDSVPCVTCNPEVKP